VQLWQDYQLRWEPSDFGGITVIRIMASKVWKPDIVLFNKYYYFFTLGTNDPEGGLKNYWKNTKIGTKNQSVQS